jgi:two-component system cell cycle response regulator
MSEKSPRSDKQMDTYIVEAEPRGMRRKGVFTVANGIEAGRVLSIPVDQVSSLGRAPECTFPLDDVGLSREHAQMVVIGNGKDYVIKDAGSRNGTYVNDARISGPVKLNHGDRVQLGSTLLYFSLVSEQEEEALKRVYEAAVRDGLTSVFNRKHLEERLAAELSFAIRQNTSLVVMMFDVDHFKRVNDTFGHLAGDAVLKTVAWVLSQGLRAEDMVARYGGEEFVVLSRGVDVATGMQIAERLRWNIAATPINVGPQMIQVTASAGVASLACCAPNFDRATLLGLADQRLYHATPTGRNRVVGAW